MIEVPRSTDPAISIVIVSYGAQEWLARTCESLVEHTAVPFELIVVDNDSPDGTGAWASETLVGATVIRNRVNVGFGVGCNQGAAAARADVLAFLNPDVLASPGWVEPLLLALAAPGVGAVGPLLTGPGGELQLAGALVDRAGHTARHGLGDPDISRSAYRVARAVDYLAGACVLVRRVDFDAVGGFDPVYGLAYFEDADLALALASLGLRSVVVPAVALVHVGDVSGGSRTLGDLAEANRQRFATRWGSVIDARPAFELDASPRRIVAARDAPSSGRVLVISDGRTATDALVAHDRWLAITSLCATSVGDVRVEHPDGDVDATGFLEGRPFHYDLVVGADPSIERAVRATQPSATWMPVADRDGLVRAGFAPSRDYRPDA